MSDAVDTIGSQMLESHLPAVAVEVYSIVGGSVAMSRERMIGATGIVASALTGIFPEEYASGIDHLLGQLLVVSGLQNQVFRRIGIREVDGLLLVLDEYQPAILQGFGSNLLAGK